MTKNPTEFSRNLDERDAISMTAWNKPDNKNCRPLYVPLIDAPNWFSISRDTLYRAEKRGEIKIYKASTRSLIKISEIESWIEKRTTSA